MSGEACGQLVEADEAMVNGAEVPDVVAEAFDEGADSIWMVDGDVEVSDNSPNVRRDAIAHLKELLKKHEISEDDERRAQDEIQKLTDKHIVEMDKYLAEKEKDLMAV